MNQKEITIREALGDHGNYRIDGKVYTGGITFFGAVLDLTIEAAAAEFGETLAWEEADSTLEVIRNEAMPTAQKVRLLSAISTRDEAGQRYTEAEILALEAAGLIEVTRPIHDSTGIPYDREHWTVGVTDAGMYLVDAYPEYQEAGE